MHMDPEEWQQPQQFRPERFLDSSGNVTGREHIMPFGLGTLILVATSTFRLDVYCSAVDKVPSC